MLASWPLARTVPLMPSTIEEKSSRASKWHQSGLSQITGCSRQWYLEHVAGLPVPERVSTLPGTAYHKAVEVHEQARIDGVNTPSMDECIQVATAVVLEGADRIDPDELANAKLGKKTGVDALVAQADAAVRNFFTAPIEDGPPIVEVLAGWTPVSLETYLSADLIDGARTLGGTVDGLYRSPTGRLRVIDHKTANSMSTWTGDGKGSEQATHYSVLALLAGLAEELPPVDFLIVKKSPPRKGSVTSMIKSYYPTHTDVVLLGQTVRTAEQIVSDGVFPPDPAYQWCRRTSCAFYDRCVGSRELFGPVQDLPV